MPMLFCCTNIDLFSYDEFSALEHLEPAPHVVHCLGLCHYCAEGKLAVVNGVVIVGETAEDFWQALSVYSAQSSIEQTAANHPRAADARSSS
ncbi:MAG: hypothetical protein CYG59_11830 [Chloroflexi bacterium]|nr:MAG: hypothetical protein CYG59_11830 [Chloroflexota bacterium]